MVEYSVVVPAYNEGENLKTLVPNLVKALKPFKKEFEIIIVNDNSKDNSFEVLTQLQKKYRQLKPIHRTKNEGVGIVIRQGLAAAKGNVIITLDGDNSHDPAQIPEFLNALKIYDMVCGSRYVEGGSAKLGIMRKAISGVFNLIFRNVIGLQIRDFTSGYRAYKRQIIDTIHLTGTGFGTYIEIPIKATLAGFKLGEVPIHYERRRHGESNLNYRKHGPEYVKIAVKAVIQKFF